MNAILKDEPPELAIARIPPVLESVLRHCLEKRPEERFRTAHDLSFALGAVTQSSTPSGASAPQQAGRRRAGAVLALLAAAGSLAAATAIARLMPRSAPEPPTYRRLTFRRGTIYGARFAPDGQTVVYTAGWNGQPPEVFTSRIGNPEWRPLGLQGWVTAVSSTGEMAVVLGDRDMLARVPLAGGAPRDVLDSVVVADFSPDGSQLLVVRQVAGRFRLEYPIGRILYEASALMDDARVSPTGREVAFLELATMGSHTGTVTVLDAAGRKRTLGSVWSDVRGLC